MMEASSDLENVIYQIVEKYKAFTFIKCINCTILACKSLCYAIFKEWDFYEIININQKFDWIFF